MITKIENIGGISALIIGLPIGFIFSAFTLYISLFPMFDFGIAFLGGKLFWSPIIWGGIIPLTYILLLWRAGKKIHSNINKGYSVFKCSFLFTLFVNVRLLILVKLIFIIGGVLNNFEGKLELIGISLILTALFFTIATLFTTLTIGLGIIKLTKKISSQNHE